MNMALKTGVDALGLKPEILLAIAVVQSIYSHRGVPMTITSLLDGDHGPVSKHYEGGAFDIRSAEKHGLPAKTDDAILADIKAALGPQYFAQVEFPPGDPNRHIHVQVRKDIKL